jgi:uncharacterized protein
MAGLFLDSPSEAEFAGVFAVEIAPPRVIEGVSNGYIGFVGQFSWGPHNTLYTPNDTVDFYAKFEPAGSPRASSGYHALMRRKKLALKVVRVLGADSAAASGTITATDGNATVTAKYHGTLGNSITVQQMAAASGNTAFRDFVVTLTHPVTGTTQETFADVPLPSGADVVVDVGRSKLLGSFVIPLVVTAWGTNATVTLTGGDNGDAPGASDYTGTAGLADKGIALLEVDEEVRVVCTDDCGDGIRAAVNAALSAHVSDKGERIAIPQFNPTAADWTAVKAGLTSGLKKDRVLYVGAWTKVFDDAGALQLSPLSTMIATAIINLEPHQSHAWWDDVALQYYEPIQEVVANFSVTSRNVRKEAFSLGIVLPIKVPKVDKWAIQHDRNTNVNPAKRYTVRRRVLDYLALSLTGATQSYVNGPNVAASAVELKAIVDNFLERELARGRITAFRTDITSVNNPTTIGLGEFYMLVEATSPAPREKIFFLMNVGPTVQIAEQG